MAVVFGFVGTGVLLGVLTFRIGPAANEPLAHFIEEVFIGWLTLIGGALLFTPLFVKDYMHARRGGLVLLPGSLARKVIEFFYSRKTVERVFLPVLADMQTEWVEAEAEKQRWRARWIRLRGYWHLLQHLGLHSIIGTIRTVWTVLKL
jgi:hypothetical protein